MFTRLALFMVPFSSKTNFLFSLDIALKTPMKQCLVSPFRRMGTKRLRCGSEELLAGFILSTDGNQLYDNTPENVK